MFNVYIKETCPYSISAMRLLERLNLQYKKFNVMDLGNTNGAINKLKSNGFIDKSSRHKTVPIIFGPTGEFIGGYDNLKIFLKQ